MGKLVSLKVDGKIFELRPAQKANIFEILESATVVPDGMEPRTMTGTNYEPIVVPKKEATPKMKAPTVQPKKTEKTKKKGFGFNKNK